MSQATTAMKVREHKGAAPHLYCPVPKCLWRVRTRQGVSLCRNHPASQRVADIEELKRQREAVSPSYSNAMREAGR